MHRYVQKDIQGTTEPQFRNSHSRTSGTVTFTCRYPRLWVPAFLFTLNLRKS